ncbi:MAG TPA: alpha/beta hydrolase [Thermoanaerobaculia bacterium]|nr:alpha/beta hydrolase [Thermoanaerobaculia bacterium]
MADPLTTAAREREGYVELNENRTFYIERGGGEGVPIILVHGWSLDVTYWRQVMDHLPPGVRVWAYDLRGMGQSSGGETPYRFELLVDDLEAFRQTFGIDRPLVCGHSLGGDLAAQYAVSFPGRAASFVLIDAPGRPNLLINPIVAFLLRVALPLLKWLGMKQPLKLLVPLLRILFFSPAWRRNHPRELVAWRWQFLQSNVHAIVNALAAEAYRRVLRLALQEVTEPVTVVRGSRDLIVSQRQADSFVRCIANSTFKLLRGSGHMTPVERPAELAEIIAEAAAALASSRAALPGP